MVLVIRSCGNRTETTQVIYENSKECLSDLPDEKRCMANDREKIEDKANELVVNVISSGFLTTPCFNWTKKMLKS